MYNTRINCAYIIGNSTGGRGWYRIAKSYFNARSTITKIYITNFYSYAQPHPICITITTSHNEAKIYCEDIQALNNLFKYRLVKMLIRFGIILIYILIILVQINISAQFILKSHLI